MTWLNDNPYLRERDELLAHLVDDGTLAGDTVWRVVSLPNERMNRKIMVVSEDGRSVFLYADSEDWIGHLYFDANNHWTFVGNVDASARALFDALALMTGRSDDDGCNPD